MVRKSLPNNRLGIVGWLNPAKHNLERWAYTFQRISGVVIAAYFVAHVFALNTVTRGPDAWAEELKIIDSTLARALVLVPLIAAVVFHGLNGLRLVFTQFGVGLRKPGRPDYPYKPGSLTPMSRAYIWLAIILAIGAVMYGISIMF